MRAILYLKQILVTHPHLKEYYVPIGAKRTEPVWGLRTGGSPRAGVSTVSGQLWGPAAQAEREEGAGSQRETLPTFIW